MHNAPIMEYNGLTIITNPSRFDIESGNKKLISGNAGDYFDVCLNPISRLNCDIITSDAFSGFREGTKCALLLGESATKLFGYDDDISILRGYPLQLTSSVIGLPTFHHQECMDRRDYESSEDESEGVAESDNETKGKGKTKRRNWRWWYYTDIKKCGRLLREHKGILPIEDEWTRHLYPSADMVLEKLRTWENKTIILDIETTSNFTMTCFGIGCLEEKTCYVVPWKRYNNELAYNETDCRELMRWLTLCLGRNKCVLHNAMFDLFILAWRYKILPPRNVFDTMLAWHRVRPECEKSLGHLISYFTWFPYHKGDGIFEPKNQSQDNQLWNYNSDDIVTTAAIYTRIQDEIKKAGAEESVQLAMREIPSYLSLSLFGARMDIERRNTRIKELLTKQKAIDLCLSSVCRQELNPRSSQQVSKYLYGRLGYKCPREDEPTKESTLRKLQLKNNPPSLQLILASRAARKSASSLAFNGWGAEANRMTCAWILTGTDTYRLGSRKLCKQKNKKGSGFGSNFQNWSKENRDLILADEGKILIQVDQAGAEALIVSYLCRAGKFRDLFISGVKPHVFVGLHLFRGEWKRRFVRSSSIDELCGLNPRNIKTHPDFEEVKNLIASSDDWPAKERYYFMAKMTCHSANYDIKWPTFQQHMLDKSEGQVVLDNSEAKRFLEHYHMLFPEIRLWHMDIQNELKNNGRKLTNLFGHPRHFNEQWGDTLFKQAYAFKPQSTVGQITNYAICETHEAIEQRDEWTYDLDILQNGHDSILCQTRIGKETIVGTEIKKRLERDLEYKGVKFKMKSEIQAGHNWKPYDEKKNPNGLRTIKI